MLITLVLITLALIALLMLITLMLITLMLIAHGATDAFTRRAALVGSPARRCIVNPAARTPSAHTVRARRFCCATETRKAIHRPRFHNCPPPGSLPPCAGGYVQKLCKGHYMCRVTAAADDGNTFKVKWEGWPAPFEADVHVAKHRYCVLQVSRLGPPCRRTVHI